MAKKLIQIGVCVLLAGCTPSGTRQQPLFSKATPPSEPTQQLAQQQPAETEQSPFSVGKMLEFVGFQSKQPGQTETTQTPAVSILPPEVTRLNSLIGEVAGRAAELSAHDPPETTRQKATEILAALQQWEGQLAQSQASGSLQTGTTQLLDSFVGQIRDQCQRLLQYAPSPESIAAIKQTASNLYAAGQTLGGVMQQFSGVQQAIANQAGSTSSLR